MMFNQIVVQQEAIGIVNDFHINYQPYGEGLYVMDSVESTSALLYQPYMPAPHCLTATP